MKATQLKNKKNRYRSHGFNLREEARECSGNIPLVDDGLPDISSKATFFQPRFLAESQLINYVPFYFWLTEAINPRVFLDLNIDSGVSYFAICQAMDKLNINGYSYASISDACDIKKIMSHNDDYYSDFSKIMDKDSQSLISLCDNSSVDIVMLKSDSCFLSSEDNWSKLELKLSSRGIVLIHDCNSDAAHDFCSFLKTKHPSFEFIENYGLLLLCVGNNTPDKVLSLIEQSKNLHTKRMIQNVYTRLGSASEHAWLCSKYIKEIEALTCELSCKDNDVNKLIKENDKLRNELCSNRKENLKLSHDLNVRFDELSKMTKIVLEVESDLNFSKIENNRLKLEIDECYKKEKDINNEISRRFEEISKITNQLLVREEEIKKLQLENERIKNNLILVNAKNKELSLNVDVKSQDNEILEKKIMDCNKEIHSLQEKIKKLESNLGVEKTLSKELKQELNKIISESLSLKSSLNDRFDEIAILTKELAARDAVNGVEKDTSLADGALLSGPVLVLDSEVDHKKNSDIHILSKSHEITTIKDKLKFRFRKNKKNFDDINLIKSSELFDEEWYKNSYPNSLNHKHGPAGHYLEFGCFTNINPSIKFDGGWYLDTYSDVKESEMNPLVHFIKFGRKELRQIKGLL
ncbi:hypothetical protein [Vibrio metschnikovii]|uniref:hypothetical protein n=1 Tax=Vibrio metschnikovii TaxID=28172 RepID=UPI001C30366D|nr:hypothetical protein [Vibrio metschnikovii]